MDFSNKVCVVTGGANGIGKTIVKEFLASGARVAIIDMDAHAGEKLLNEHHSDQLLFYSGDIANEEVIINFVQEVLNRFSSVDYLINNACISRAGILSGCSYEDFNYILRIGVSAPYQLTKLLLNHFNNGASIVNISSSRALMSEEDTESYSAAKGGISSLTHALSISLAGRVRVNSISPGWIETDPTAEHSEADKIQHPVRRIGTPKDIAKMVQFLCSEDSSFITGENITIDGGMTKQMIYHNTFGWTYKPTDNRMKK